MEKERLKVELRRANHIQGGSTGTKAARARIKDRVISVLQGALNIQVPSFTKLRTRQVEAYVQFRKDCGVSLPSLQIDLAHVRQILRALERSRFANHSQLSNKAMGVDVAKPKNDATGKLSLGATPTRDRQAII